MICKELSRCVDDSNWIGPWALADLLNASPAFRFSVEEIDGSGGKGVANTGLRYDKRRSRLGHIILYNLVFESCMETGGR